MAQLNNRKDGSGFTRLNVALLLLCGSVLQRILMNLGLGVSSSTSDSPTPISSSRQQPLYRNPLAIPEGRANNLPSVRVSASEKETERSIYGGKGDGKHLGGFTDIDMQGISPASWKHVVSNWTVHSVLDVGCGRGISTSWFVTHGLRTECVEGSHDAIQQNMVPDKSILTEHDFSRGPWWPEKTFDMVWSVEFLEHVNLHNQYNFISVFRKAAIIMVTSSSWGGWHHVEVHKEDWWINKFEAYGFKYNDRITQEIRKIAREEKEIFPPNGKNLRPQHIYRTMKVFINPVVASLPEHAHLFGEAGCFQSRGTPNRECGKAESKSQQKTADDETPLDPSFYPLKLNPGQDQAWYDIVEANIQQPK